MEIERIELSPLVVLTSDGIQRYIPMVLQPGLEPGSDGYKPPALTFALLEYIRNEFFSFLNLTYI